MKRNITFFSTRHVALLGIAVFLGLASCKDDDDSTNPPATENVGMNNLMLKGDYEVPAVTTTATGSFSGTYEKVANKLTYTITFSGLTPTAAHFHVGVPGVAGPVALPINGPYTSPLTGTVTLTNEQEIDLLAGRWYVNLHTDDNPAGEIRGQLVTDEVKFDNIALNGANEVPAVTTNATGELDGTYRRSTKTLQYSLTFSGLTPTSAHFHRAPVGVSGPVEKPIDGPYISPLNATTDALSADQEADLINGLWYVNLHTADNPPGEIRGQLITGQ